MELKEALLNEERYLKIEAKFNSAALRTGKNAFEVVSHSSRGWGMTSKCDYFYFVFGDEIGENKYTINKRVLISLSRWNDFIDDKLNRRELYYNKDEDGIVNIMTYLDDMEKKNVSTLNGYVLSDDEILAIRCFTPISLVGFSGYTIILLIVAFREKNDIVCWLFASGFLLFLLVLFPLLQIFLDYLREYILKYLLLLLCQQLSYSK